MFGVPAQASAPTPPPPRAANALDLIFIIDATGSMGSYIASATRNIETICDKIVESELLSAPGALRVGLISYRDHPPQDHVYIVRNFGFAKDVQEMKSHLKSLFAAGGGDGPEAATAALAAAVELPWRTDAAKMAILVTDAPPHGIGEYGDGFPNGSPDGADPLDLARRMAAAGISLFVVACEPALSGYQHAVDFYKGLVQITSGMLVPLTTASLLAHVVVAAASEVMDMDRLHREVGDAVLERLQNLSLSTGESHTPSLLDTVARELHEKLSLRNESTRQLIIDDIYRESPESTHNVHVWSTAENLFVARPHIRKVIGSRLSQKFIESRRKGLYAKATPSSVSDPAPAATPSAPRRVVSDFSPFSVPGMSVAGTEVAAGPQMSEYRSSDPIDDDGDDDMDEENSDEDEALQGSAAYTYVSGDDGQRLALRQDTISLEQARRLTTQSVARRQFT
ncbi:hypothetical protein MCUN1_000886 [Malassezia cuniculi]|uniref:VWFA domain-containing protein n=1 Tax=Malassezia cuniculi TaxID=948313 RepID=A0AAF0EWN9_9BASI|nr:hypothetical protein MCUN1_000886 [Malassezia cuniculi]